MNRKRVFIFLISIFIIYNFSSVGALGFSISNVNSTLATVSISGASSVYSYEVNLDYGGSIGTASFFGYLAANSTTTTGLTTRGSVATAYESQLNTSRPGVSGSGDLFNITHSGSLSRRFIYVVYSDGSDEYVYYNQSSNPSSPDSEVYTPNYGGVGGNATRKNTTGASQGPGIGAFRLPRKVSIGGNTFELPTELDLFVTVMSIVVLPVVVLVILILLTKRIVVIHRRNRMLKKNKEKEKIGKPLKYKKSARA